MTDKSPEPVAWTDPKVLEAFKTNPWISGTVWSSQRGGPESSVPLYATPPAPQPPVNGDVVAMEAAKRAYQDTLYDDELGDAAYVVRAYLAALSASPPQGGSDETR